MGKKTGGACRLGIAMAGLGLALGAVMARADDRGAWAGTWQTSPTALPATNQIGSFTLPTPSTVKGTIRYRIRISQGGDGLRLRFSNEAGDAPLLLTAASIGKADDGLNAVKGSVHAVTFGGRASITIPAGAPAVSDAIRFPSQPLEDLVISVYLRDGIAMYECNPLFAQASAAVVDEADVTMNERPQNTRCLYTIRPVVSEIDAHSARSHKVVAAFGDSITDGRIDPANGERGWPGVLARRLSRAGVGVVNAGIGGNRLLDSVSIFGVSALSRFDRDVLSVPGLTHIVLLEGINDIGMSGADGMFGSVPVAQAQDLIEAYRQIIDRAHAHGVAVIGATLLPFQSAHYYTAEKEKVRQTVNAWLRTAKQFDGIIDFDTAMRDPESPAAMNAAFDSGDHLHPNAAGYAHMGESIDLKLFER